MSRFLKIGIPDIEETKNKKIVQLTKVIYHLNTQCEEHENEIKNLSKTYEKEIQQILKDSYDKIDNFRKDTIEWEQKAKTNKLYTKLLEKYEREKILAMSHFDKLKASQNKKIEQIRGTYKDEISTIYADSQSAINEMKNRVENYRKLMESMKKNHSATIVQIKSKFDHQIGEIKYKNEQMILHKNATFDKLRQGIINQYEADAVKISDMHKIQLSELQKVHKTQITNLQKARNDESKILNQSNERLRAEKNELKSMLNSAKKEVETLKLSLDEQQTKNDALNSKISAIICEKQEIEKKMNAALKVSEADNAATYKNYIAIKQSLQIKEKDFNDLTIKYQEMLKLIEEKNQNQIGIATENDKFSHQIKILRSELQSANESITQITNEKTKILQNAKLNEGHFKADIERLRKELNVTKSINQSNINALNASQKRNKFVTNQYQKVYDKLNQTKSAISETKINVNAIQNKYKLFSSQYQTNFIKFKQSMHQMNDILNGKTAQNLKYKQSEFEYESKMKTMQNEKKIIKDALEKKLNNLQSDLLSARNDNKSSIQNIKALNKNIEKLKQTLLAKQSEIDVIKTYTSQNKNDYAQNLKDKSDQINVLNAKCDELLQNINDEKQSHEQSKINFKKLKVEHENEINRLQALNKQTLKEKRNTLSDLNKMKQSISSSQQEWEQKLKNQSVTNEKSMNNLRESNRLERELLKNQYDDNKTEIIADHKAAINELMTKMAETKNAHQNELNELKQHLKETQMSAKQESMNTKSEIQKLETMHQQKLMQKIKDIENEMNGQFNNQKQKMQKQFESEMSGVNKQNEDKTNNLLQQKQSEIDSLQTNINKLDQQITALKKEINDKQIEFDQEKEKLYDYFKQEAKEFELEKKDLFDAFAAETKENLLKHHEEIQKLNDSNEQILSEMKSQHTSLQNQFEALTVKYKNRPSRKEDLDKIEQLNTKIKQQQKEVEATDKNMKKLKQDLLNREKNFNGMFGRKPKVGVMHVGKGKENQNRSRRTK